MNRRSLERRLESVAGFDDPRVEWEQYPTPAPLAAHLVHLAALQGDFDRPVVDLGTGTGMLALGARLLGATEVVGVDRDPSALAIAVANADRVDAPGVSWVLGDATRPPLCPREATVLMNPPFGAQHGREHADRAFLDAARRLARVTYSVHNAGSRGFVEAFADDAGGTVTHAFGAEFDLDRQFAFHTSERHTLDVEVFRVVWE
ncbi:METTL5 family protein [Halomarina litorea]|uniref:METTL5 family protein n=1 Tax=Halomarina litorea TaxID=2961595 RepID=UPI0020C2D76A|nr:METTL5 family protein [Halomarina sp. BCD28]